MHPIDLIDNHRRDLAESIARMPATRLLGLTVLGLGDGVSLLQMPIRPEITFEGRTVQGGIVATLGDYAAVSAVTAALPAGWAASTTGIEAHNLDPARGARLLAVGRSCRAGKGLSLGEARVYVIDREDGSREDGNRNDGDGNDVPPGTEAALARLAAAEAGDGGRLVAVMMATCRAFELPR